MFTTHHKIKTQSGVSIVTAIFLVVILSLMGVGMVSILTTSQQSIGQEITSAKAYMAGRSCLQWGMYQAIYDADPWNNSPHTLTFNNNGLINTGCETGFTVIINDSKTFFNLTTTANFGNATDPEFSQRQMRLQFQPSP
jgi:MSHA biogenesis protein MshP